MSAFPTNPYTANEPSRRRLGHAVLTTVAVQVYRVPPGKSAIIERIVIANTQTNSRTIDLYHMAPGDTASTEHAIMYQVSVAGKATVYVDGPFYLVDGEELQAKADQASHLTLHLHGIESA